MFWSFTGRWCTTYVNCSASHLSFKSTGGGGKSREEWIGTRSDVGGCHVTHELGFITARLIRLFQWLFRRPFSRIAFLMPRSREKEREPTVWLYRLQALFFYSLFDSDFILLLSMFFSLLKIDELWRPFCRASQGKNREETKKKTGGRWLFWIGCTLYVNTVDLCQAVMSLQASDVSEYLRYR